MLQWLKDTKNLLHLILVDCTGGTAEVWADYGCDCGQRDVPEEERKCMEKSQTAPKPGEKRNRYRLQCKMSSDTHCPVGKLVLLASGWRCSWQHDVAKMRWRIVESKCHRHAGDKYTASNSLA